MRNPPTLEMHCPPVGLPWAQLLGRGAKSPGGCAGWHSLGWMAVTEANSEELSAPQDLEVSGGPLGHRGQLGGDPAEGGGGL